MEQMQPDQGRNFTLFEVAFNRVTRHRAKILPGIALGKDRMAYSFSRESTILFSHNVKDDFAHGSGYAPQIHPRKLRLPGKQVLHLLDHHVAADVGDSFDQR